MIAKPLDLPYQAGNRDGMQKIKRYKSADCVVGGFRYGENIQSGRKVVGSILLGLYDAGGLLHVGFSSGIKAKDKPALTDKLEAIRQDRSFTGNAPGRPSRWSTKRSSEWQPVRPKYVVGPTIMSPAAGSARARPSSGGDPNKKQSRMVGGRPG